jgi:hypothetical protein
MCGLCQNTTFAPTGPWYLLCPVKSIIFGTTLAFFVSGATIYAREEIKTYTIPKEVQRLADAAAVAAGQSQADTATPVKWTTPSDWQQQPARDMVIGSMSVPGKDGKSGEVSITTFPGDVGGEQANVGRWQAQVGAPSSASVKGESVTVGGIEGKLYDISGENGEIIAASIPREGATWFFKLKGDKETVASAKPAFREFLKSVQFTSGASAETAAPSAAPVDPHAGLGNVAAESAGTGPKMDVPSNWKEKAPGPMVVKSYSVTGSQGGEAVVAISTFGGDVGGKLANVNRWRAQLGQAPVDDAQLNTVAEAFDTQGGSGYMVDLEGTNSKTGQPARLVAIAVPHDGATWFYKLLGDKNTVMESKAAFLKFVKNVRY